LQTRETDSNPAVSSDSFHAPRFSGKPSLIEAIRTDNPKKLQKALDQGANIHEKYPEMLKALSFLFVVFGGKPQYNEMNALHVAADSDSANPQSIQILLNKGIGINSREAETQWTALHRHMYQYSPNKAATKKLLEQGVDVNAKDSSGKTALHVLMDHRYTKKPKPAIMQLLRKYGADLKAKDKYGNTPLDLMAHRADPDLKAVQYLIRTGSSQAERNALKEDFLNKYHLANCNREIAGDAKATAAAKKVYQKTMSAIQAFSTKELTGKDHLDPEAPLWQRFCDSISGIFEALLNLFRSGKKPNGK